MNPIRVKGKFTISFPGTTVRADQILDFVSILKKMNIRIEALYYIHEDTYIQISDEFKEIIMPILNSMFLTVKDNGCEKMNEVCDER